MNAETTRPVRAPAVACSACQDDDPCLPCALASTGDAAGPVAVRRVLRGEVLFREGDPCRAIHTVRSGTLKTLIPGLDGREQVTSWRATCSASTASRRAARPAGRSRWRIRKSWCCPTPPTGAATRTSWAPCCHG
jgi:CRP-like cAMP-binding protein